MQEGNSEYIQQAAVDSRQGVVLKHGVGRGSNDSSPKKRLLRNVTNRLGLGQILWHVALVWERRNVYRILV
jgi:hypothetical protein